MRIAVGVATLSLVATTLGTAQSSPANGDTVGYWQQRITYTIVATLDEPMQRLRARGTLLYVNNSPDTLREMYFHQYLNAFRPGSKWSAVDEREGRERFQHLREPDYGYERFTAPVSVNGVPVVVDYPGAPDSTVAHIRLPGALSPGDSLSISFEWDARPSTVPRRQGRRGRSYDFAQWYPKVAVYDRGGWEPNALQPAGELYGEYGTYDVALRLANDQVVGATGVPVEGDPGWNRALRAGIAYRNEGAYNAPRVDSPRDSGGFKTVRFYARDVHHFGWSTSPDYRYEGGVYVRRLPKLRWPTWDTVAIHVLYRAGDDTTWAGGRALRRTAIALQWLETFYGAYTYPQMTVLHRLDRGGTEFPMMQMNGSASQGLILHEGGHNWTYGILGNNEWKSGWMDEGFTSYQTDVAQGFTPQERVRAGLVDVPIPDPGYSALARRMALPRFESMALDQEQSDLEHRSQPIGTVAHQFRDFATYNGMIYDRAQIMYGQLRDVLGDSAFIAFTHDYYSRWALRHVDETAMRASAERVSGKDLGWFFDQWVHHTGLMDYSLDRVRTRDSSGVWITEATVHRRGEYLHPMSVGARTSTGWTIARMADPRSERETLRIVTNEKPIEVRLDPNHFAWDWDRRNDRRGGRVKFGVDWPLLVQADRDKQLALFRPAAWYSDRGGAIVGVHHSSNYLGLIDKVTLDVAYPTRACIGATITCVQEWARLENPRLMARPLIGWSFDLGVLDDIGLLAVRRRRDWTMGSTIVTNTVALTALGTGSGSLLPENWRSNGGSADLEWRGRFKRTRSDSTYRFADWRLVAGMSDTPHGFGKIELAAGQMYRVTRSTTLGTRLFFGQTTNNAPPHRALYLSAEDPVATFDNHYWRPRGSLLKELRGRPLGGGGLRGYSYQEAATRLVSGNGELSQRLVSVETTPIALDLWLLGFGDIASVRFTPTSSGEVRGDWGIGARFTGRFYDQPFDFQIDAPLRVEQSGLASSGRIRGHLRLIFRTIW